MSFSDDVKKFNETAKTNMEEAVRAVFVRIGTVIISRTPVGDISLWALNEGLGLDSLKQPQVVTKAMVKLPGRFNLKKFGAAANFVEPSNFKFRFKAGKTEYEDYRPGTLVNSWFSGVGEVPPELKVRERNVNGATSLANLEQTSKAITGKIAYFVNPAPYARRIEFGWSTQAPEGMVRRTAAEYQKIVKVVANGII